MMGIATISIDGEDDVASAVVADSGARAHWVFTDEEPSVVSARSTVALATASRTTSSTEVHLQEDKLFVQLGEKHDEGETRWILDTGATNHMTGDRSFFSELDTGVHGTVKFGDGSVVNIEGRGTILFMCKTGEHHQLGGVYFIPKLTANIISLGQLDEDKFKVLIEEGVLRIWDQRRRLLAKVPRSANRLYILDVNISAPVCLAAHADDVAWTWHTRYGHLGFNGLKLLSRKEMVRGLPAIEHVDQVCEGRLTGKQRRQPFPAASKFRASRSLELVHADLCGPITPPTPGGKNLFLLVVDDRSRYMWLTLLASKDGAAEAIIQLQARLEKESGEKMGTLQTDRGGEFTSRTFQNYCVEHGVQRHLTAP